MAAIDLGGLPYSQIGQLQIRSRSGTIPATIPRIGGWAVDPIAECAFVEDAGLSVPSTAVSIGALKYTPDGALYVTADTTTGPFTNIGGLKVRQDGAACIITKTPSVTLDPYIGGAAYDGATSAMVVGGAGFGFILPLVTTIRPTAGVGGATFTRATTATVEDWETVVRPVLSSEVRFQGARRVRNLFTFSQDQTNVAWNKTSAVVTSGFADPQGGTGACRVVGTGVWGVDQSLTAGASLVSLWVKSNTGLNQTFRIRRAGAASSDVTATTEWKRVSDLGGASAGNVNGILRDAANNNVDILVYAFQFEDTTGQSNTNPSEYVSVGVLSTPYHGANVDGVKYFATQNGNTVVSNVVAEATGAAISASILKGYLAEGARTNLCLQSEDFATTWTVTANSSITVNSAVAPDGNTTADSLNEDATATTAHPVSQLFAKAASALPYSLSVFVKPVGRTWTALTLYDNVSVGTRYWFNLSGAGTVGSTAAIGAGFTAASASIQAYPNGWYRCTLNATSNAVASLIAFLYSTDADLSLTPAVGLNGAGLRLWGAQLEQASFPSSNIPTTTVAVTRNADVLTYPFAGNASAAVGTAYAELSIQWATAPAGVVWSAVSLNGRGPLYEANTAQSTFISASDDTNFIQKTGLSDMSVAPRKRAASWGAGISVTGDGLAPATGAFTGNMGNVAIGIGIAGTAGGNNWAGTIKNVMISQSQLTDAQLAALTA